ncbi:hypothetical protein [Yersinia massiliensis]|uniref:hypothetical protein n=1 Tax=Yersinia massiliensis TaxID=419257 RepID=UPI0002EA58AF|nr:hypothetical protein [Yersinia massiliensis]QKJ09349.1 hypothetical protein HRD68_00620 [Yersinia massiliensis]
MFNFKRKSLSLAQLKEKEQDLIKSNDVCGVFAIQMVSIALAFMVTSIGIDIVQHKEITPQNIIDALYIISLVLQLMGVGLISSAAFLGASNIYTYRSLRKITQTIEALSVQEDIPHAE